MGLLQNDGGAAAMEIGDGAAIDVTGRVDIIGALQAALRRRLREVELPFLEIDAGDEAIDIVDRHQPCETLGRVVMNDERFVSRRCGRRSLDPLGTDEVSERVVEPDFRHGPALSAAPVAGTIGVAAAIAVG